MSKKLIWNFALQKIRKRKHNGLWKPQKESHLGGGGEDDVLHIHWDDVLHIHQGFKRVVMRDGPVELGHFL